MGKCWGFFFCSGTKQEHRGAVFTLNIPRDTTIHAFYLSVYDFISTSNPFPCLWKLQGDYEILDV
jgi:hypothetical protein